MKADEEHGNARESDADAEDLGNGETTPTRRDFLSKSAEVAALSLLGVTAFDAVVQRVLERAAELDGLKRIAESAAAHLEESGVIGMAHALEGGCDDGKEYTCGEGTTPPFDACGKTEYVFDCEWSKTVFWCDMSGESYDFDCKERYACPPIIGGFHCVFADFDCTYPSPFECGGAAAAYLCPDTDSFFAVCQTGTPYQCPHTGPFDNCQTAQGKSCQAQQFDCGGQVGYHCALCTRFECGTTNVNYFDCSHESDSTYDFTCQNLQGEGGGYFACDNGGQGSFVCDTNHLFGCYEADFYCKGTTFTCSAGGNKCGIGATGDYNIDSDQPGDFSCGRKDGTFTCREGGEYFDCKSVDDFTCAYGGGSYTCVSPFDDCAPQGNDGVFECYLDKGFTCQGQGGETFECLETMKFSQIDE